MKKYECNEANFEILENGAKGGMLGGMLCVWENEYREETVKDCDCSDPGSYSFYNEGRF